MRGNRNFRQGGSRSVWHIKLWQRFFFFFFFFVLSYFYGSQMVNLNKIYNFSRFQRSPTFSRGGGGGVQLFPGEGVQLIIPSRNPYNLWFSRGGVRTPCPPLWIRTWVNIWWKVLSQKFFLAISLNIKFIWDLIRTVWFRGFLWVPTRKFWLINKGRNF